MDIIDYLRDVCSIVRDIFLIIMAGVWIPLGIYHAVVVYNQHQDSRLSREAMEEMQSSIEAVRLMNESVIDDFRKKFKIDLKPKDEKK